MFLRKKTTPEAIPRDSSKGYMYPKCYIWHTFSEKRSKSKKLTKSTFNKCVLLRISVRIQCPIPNCPKSHIRHKKKIKNLNNKITIHEQTFKIAVSNTCNKSVDFWGIAVLNQSRPLPRDLCFVEKCQFLSKNEVFPTTSFLHKMCHFCEIFSEGCLPTKEDWFVSSTLMHYINYLVNYWSK